MDASLVNQVVVAVATLLASLGGYLLAGLNERHRDERTLDRELRLRFAEREAQLDEDRHALQRTTLLALQDALQAEARFSGQVVHFDHMQARQGEYTPLPDQLNDDSYANLVEVRRLTSRVLDSDVRDAVERFIEISVRVSILPEDLRGLSGDRLEDTASAKVVALNDGYLAVSCVVGEAVRREIAWHPSERAAL